ncbi:unnamed protein product, partial [Didymodactylos carnosus]
PYTRTFINLIMNTSYDTRRYAYDILRRLVNNLQSETDICNSILDSLTSYLEHLSQTMNETAMTINDETNTYTKAMKALEETLICLATALKTQSDDVKALVSTKSLLVCCLSSNTFSITGVNLWQKIIYYIFNKDYSKVNDYLQNNVDILVDTCTTSSNNLLTETQMDAISLLCSLRPLLFIRKFLLSTFNRLESDRYRMVTKRDYEIMQTPDGELYDKNLMETILKHEVKDTGNIKRESKNYSYKEQMAAVELAKEISKKKNEPHQLSKKQEEMLQTALDNERVIRTNVKKIDYDAKNVFLILTHIIDGALEYIMPYIGEILSKIWPTFQSPLTFVYARDLYVRLVPIVFLEEENTFGNSVAYLAIRLNSFDDNMMKQQIDLRWTQEPVSAAIDRVLKRLQKHVNYEKTVNQMCLARLDYCLPLFKNIVRQEMCTNEWTSIILDICKEYFSCVSQIDQNNHPSLIPRRDLFRLFLDINATSKSVQIQNEATDMLQKLCELCCNYETDDDIQVLIENIKSPIPSVRESCVLSLKKLVTRLKLHPKVEHNIARRLYIACEDPEERVQKVASELWPECGLNVKYEHVQNFLEDVINIEGAVRDATSRALPKLLQSSYPELVPFILNDLFEIHEKKNDLPPPAVDQFGRLIQTKQIDTWEPRAGIAACLYHMAPLVGNNIQDLFQFYVPKALNDRNDLVSSEMLKAATKTIDLHGKDNLNMLLQIMEDFLKQAPKTADYDSVRQNVVILMGKLAKDMDKDSAKVKNILGQLISTLNTPSQQVQAAVADCLPPLVPAIKDEAGVYVKQLMNCMLQSDDYAEKKGAAYGLAGFIKGLGILAVKQYNVLDELTEAIQDKTNAKRREGALFGLEMLTTMLGRLFEVYIVNILPNLLLSFGDSDVKVREAAEDCARAIMSKLTSHGVKIVLPGLLKGLESDLWRTKCGAVELLGAMAHCAPKQLSTCLP